MANQALIQSVKTHIYKKSLELDVSNEMVLRRFAFERLLARLARSPYRDKVCLKGAMAFLAVTGDEGRPTRDMDFTGLVSMGREECLDMWREIAATTPEEEDGLTFEASDFSADEIQAGSDEPGIKVQGFARLEKTRIPLKMEVSFGHAMTPGAIVMDYPALLGRFAGPRVLCYSKETMLAEKFEAICSLGERTSRFKDFYDVRGLARGTTFDVDLAARALVATFGKRGTPLPDETPACFRPGFLETGERGWKSFKTKMALRDDQSFASLVEEVVPFIMPVVDRAKAAGEPMEWRPGQGWGDPPEDAHDDRVVMRF